MSRVYWIILLVIISTACQSEDTVEKHVFYLHGRIVELQGPEAVSAQFGAYEYTAILAALAEGGGVVVHSEVRPADVDFYAYCDRIAGQIDSLIQGGMMPAHITVVGASKGAVVAMQVAHRYEQPINYVLLGANTAYLERENDWNLHGRILAIYEKTDELAGKDYRYWIARSSHATTFEQLEINTGLGHGFFYRPLNAWLLPTLDWINYAPAD